MQLTSCKLHVAFASQCALKASQSDTGFLTFKPSKEGATLMFLNFGVHVRKSPKIIYKCSEVLSPRSVKMVGKSFNPVSVVEQL